MLFDVQTGAKGEEAAQNLRQFMEKAEKLFCTEKRASEVNQENRFQNRLGRGRPFENNSFQVPNITERKRTRPSLPFNGKRRKQVASPVHRAPSTLSVSSSTTVSSSSSSLSSSSSSTVSAVPFALQRFCQTPNLSEEEERLNEIGANSDCLNSYEELTGCPEPEVNGEGEDTDRGIENKKKEAIEQKEREEREK
ncbi:MAG: hypothetical protein JAY66_08065, partial [Candidatus Thiodiazotropha taylori]|nr:hypothetical protein [Candidatus Thiodiazotropha taylori]